MATFGVCAALRPCITRLENAKNETSRGAIREKRPFGNPLTLLLLLLYMFNISIRVLRCFFIVDVCVRVRDYNTRIPYNTI